MRRTTVILASTALVVAGLIGGTAASGAPPGGVGPDGTGLQVYTGSLDAAGLEALGEEGVDRDHSVVAPAAEGKAQVEVIITEAQANKLRAKGVDLTKKKVKGQDAARVMAEQADNGFEVWASYSEPGGIRDDLLATADAYPDLTKVVTAGQSVNGQDILAVKVTKSADNRKDGAKPAVLYGATQHAREWITPEMVQRLMHHVLEGYGSDPEITELLDTTELWFLPVQNPDGYDFTFSDDRMWRKNTRDVNGDGAITAGDGVDMNRNFPYKWGFDNEGSSPQTSAETYRGTGPASEPETQATINLIDKVGFEYFINYHSAAELLLYGTGWQVETPTPDDEIYQALAGTDDNPAVEGYDPDLSAELYTTNGDTDGHAHEVQGVLAFTPEMSTCQTISAAHPDDEWLPEDCPSVFVFPDDEELVQEEFEKNLDFALSVAHSAADPDDPVSSVGLVADDMVVDEFPVSYGSDQPVAVNAKRSLKNLRLWYQINGGEAVEVKTSEWAGGQRYGGEHDKYYAEFRGTVSGAASGDEVTAWFTANKPGTGDIQTEPFTYTVADDIGGDVLVLAAEDYTGVSPAQASGPSYADDYVASIEAAGYTTDVYDVDANGRTAPHHLGVMSHYDAVVWETGEDVLPRNTGQGAGTTAKWGYDTELNVRDYVNEGGKLLVAGKYALFGQGADGAYYYNPYEAEQGSCTTPGDYPCLPLGNDFLQYWLGAYTYVSDGGTSDTGPYPLIGEDEGPYAGFAGTLNGGDSADNQDHTAAFVSTSSYLPVEEFPQFASSAPLRWDSGGGNPYAPVTGDWFMASNSADRTYKRLAQTVDLTDATTGSLDFKISADTEADWDFVFVEAHTVGQDDWTTLPDANGNTSQVVGDSCPSGWVDELHPHLAHYMNDACEPTGTTGAWNAFSGNSNGWQDWSIDLSAYAGQQVEVSIAYVSDWATQGLGTWVDDAAVTVDGAVVNDTSFEADTGAWTVPGSPEGSAENPNDWTRAQSSIEVGAGVTTADTVYVGFGAEGLTTQAQRDDFMTRTLEHLFATD